MNDWFRLLDASVSGDKAAMHESSLKLGYLTGEENPVSLSSLLVIKLALKVTLTLRSSFFRKCLLLIWSPCRCSEVSPRAD